jgi:hypothetical protein
MAPVVATKVLDALAGGGPAVRWHDGVTFLDS